jgi:hypothetical protein
LKPGQITQGGDKDMKPKKRNESQQKAPEKSPIRQAISVATVVASLGASLGVGVVDLIAADQKAPVRGEATQHKDAISLDWGNINANQWKLSDQIKLLEASQMKFWNQIKGETRQGKIDVRQYKELQANEYKLADQLKGVRADEYKLSNQFKFWRSNLQKANRSDQLKWDGIEANELKISDQIKLLETNQIKLSEQIKMFQSNQDKH